MLALNERVTESRVLRKLSENKVSLSVFFPISFLVRSLHSIPSDVLLHSQIVKWRRGGSDNYIPLIWIQTFLSLVR